ncbi:MAG: hypothetical protein WAZ14_03400 [Patescibacteria group bacterium]
MSRSQIVPGDADELGRTPEGRFLQDVVTAKYSAIETGDVDAYADYFVDGIWPTTEFLLIEDDPEAIARVRQHYAERGGSSRVDGELEIVSIERDGERSIVQVVERVRRWDQDMFVSNPEASESVSYRRITVDTEVWLITDYVEDARARPR